MKPPSRRKRGAVVLGDAKKALPSSRKKWPLHRANFITLASTSLFRALVRPFFVLRARFAFPRPLLTRGATLLPLSFSDDFLDSRCQCCSAVSPTFARLRCVRLQPRLPFFSYPVILSPPFLFCTCFFLLSTFALPHLSLLLSLPFYFYVFYTLFLFSSLCSFLFFSLH